MSNRASHDDVTRLFRGVSDHTVVKVLDTGATVEQLEEVGLWLAQEDDVLGDERRPLTGVPAQVADWLERDEGYPEEDLR